MLGVLVLLGAGVANEIVNVIILKASARSA